MFYTPGEMRDLLVMVIERYEEAMQNQPIDKEASAIINDWVTKKADEILEDYQAYLMSLELDAEKAHNWEHGDNGY
jgi:hypothetical protein